MNSTLAPILDLLDEGMRLYRRGFVTFAALAALGITPLVGLIGGSFVVGAQGSDNLSTLLVLAALVLGLPALIYAVGAISRAALAQRAAGRVALGQALAIPPLRALGMGCYGSCFLMVVYIATSIVSTICICPLYIVLLASFGGAVGVVGGAGEAGLAAAGLLVGAAALIMVVIYAFSLALSGAAYCSALFGLQPFLHGRLRFGEAAQRGIDITFYRFGHNLLTFLCASLVFGAISLAVTLAVGLLLPLPLSLTLGTESPATRAAAGAAWLLGVVLALPPLPIWMALLYARSEADRGGGDLPARIAALVAPTTESRYPEIKVSDTQA